MRNSILKKLKALVLLSITFSFLTYAAAQKPVSLTIDLTLPEISAEPYHRPYVAVWIETTNRKGVHTLAFWSEQEEWFKDLRQWWRKIGRNTDNYDGVSGATRKPGQYKLSWQGKLANGAQLEQGDYVLHFEAVREQGSREYLKQKISWVNGEKQTFTLQGQAELGSITITIE